MLWAIASFIGLIVFIMLLAQFSEAHDTYVLDLARNQGYTKNEAEDAFSTHCLFLILPAVLCLLSGGWSLLLFALFKRDMAMGYGIALGCIGIQMCAILPGILYIIDSAKHRWVHH